MQIFICIIFVSFSWYGYIRIFIRIMFLIQIHIFGYSFVSFFGYRYIWIFIRTENLYSSNPGWAGPLLCICVFGIWYFGWCICVFGSCIQSFGWCICVFGVMNFSLVVVVWCFWHTWLSIQFAGNQIVTAPLASKVVTRILSPRILSPRNPGPGYDHPGSAPLTRWSRYQDMITVMRMDDTQGLLWWSSASSLLLIRNDTQVLIMMVMKVIMMMTMTMMITFQDLENGRYSRVADLTGRATKCNVDCLHKTDQAGDQYFYLT